MLLHTHRKTGLHPPSSSSMRGLQRRRRGFHLPTLCPTGTFEKRIRKEQLLHKFPAQSHDRLSDQINCNHKIYRNKKNIKGQAKKKVCKLSQIPKVLQASQFSRVATEVRLPLDCVKAYAVGGWQTHTHTNAVAHTQCRGHFPKSAMRDELF